MYGIRLTPSIAQVRPMLNLAGNETLHPEAHKSFIMFQNYSTLLMGKTGGKRALYRNQEDSVDSTVYQDYPKHKPFINEDYERPVHKPVSSYPEGNRTGMYYFVPKCMNPLTVNKLKFS